MRQNFSDGKDWTVAVLGYSTQDNVNFGDELNVAKPLSADLLLVQTFVRLFGLRARISFTRDGEYGVLLPNKSWTGLIGLVQRKEADFGVSRLSISPSRLKVVDFTFPYLLDGIIFLKKSNIKKLMLNVDIFFVKPFSLSIWIAVLWTLIVHIIILRIMKSIVFDLYKEYFHPTICFIKVLLKQEFKFPKTKYHCLSILLGFWLTGCWLQGQFYGGTLTSSTSVSKTKEVVENWVDLISAVTKGEIYACGFKGSNTQNTILNTQGGKFGILRESIMNTPYLVPESEKDFIPRLLGGTHALIISQFSSKIFILQNNLRYSGLYMSPEFSGVQMKSIAFKKGASFQEEFDQMTLELIETGIIEMWNGRSVVGAELRQDTSKSLQSYITMNDIKQLLLLISMLNAMSFLIFIAELCYYYLVRRKIAVQMKRTRRRY